MGLINAFISWIYNIEIPDELVAIPHHINKKESTKYNPATGLPMIGGLDTMGNIIGTDRRYDYSSHTSSMNDYYRYYSR